MINRDLGNLGEKLAVNYLSKKGYKILNTNFRCRYGEIDIVGKYKDIIVFFEVKSRRTDSFGRPIEAINTIKIKHLLKSINYYINKNKLYNHNFRIDAIEIVFDTKKEIQINHIENIIC